MNRTETLRAKMLRRALLLALRTIQVGSSEGWANERMAFHCVRSLEDYGLAEVQEELRYLAGKAYLEARDLRADKYSPPNLSYRLLPRGRDLLDGSIAADPGVEDPRA